MLDLKFLHDNYSYQDGELFRRVSGGGEAAGKKAGWQTVCNGKLYAKINIHRKTWYLHHVIFFMHHGFAPARIDHKDRDSLNNRIENLRPATQSQNMANSQARKSNTSGFKGVSWRKDTGKWGASIMVNGKHISLGSYINKEDAAQAYLDGAVKHYGEFACTVSANNRSIDRATQ